MCAHCASNSFLLEVLNKNKTVAWPRQCGSNINDVDSYGKLFKGVTVEHEGAAHAAWALQCTA